MNNNYCYTVNTEYLVLIFSENLNSHSTSILLFKQQVGRSPYKVLLLYSFTFCLLLIETGLLHRMGSVGTGAVDANIEIARVSSVGGCTHVQGNKTSW